MIKDKSVEIRGILREQQKQRRTAVCLSVGNKDVLKVVVLYGFNGCLFNLFIHQEEKLFASFFLLLSLSVFLCMLFWHMLLLLAHNRIRELRRGLLVVLYCVPCSLGGG